MNPYYERSGVTLHHGDCRAVLAVLPERSVQTCITSPPYFGMRDYGVARQIGLETTVGEYVAEIVGVFRAVWRVLRDDGTLWLNMGDAYANDGKWGGHTGGKHAAALHCSPIGRNKRYTGLKPKDLIGIPWRVAFALQDDGWYLRSDIIWQKPNPMPESVTDRPTRAHEYLFLLSRRARYHYDADAIREPLQLKTFTTFGTHHRAQGNDALGGVKSDNWGRTVPVRKPRMKRPDGWDTGPGAHGSFHREGRGKGASQEYDPEDLAGANKRDVWTVAARPYPGAHFATFPPKLVAPCVLAGCPAGGVVLDPFAGAGTTLMVAKHLGRSAIGIELSEGYCRMAVDRLGQDVLPLDGESVPEPAARAVG